MKVIYRIEIIIFVLLVFIFFLFLNHSATSKQNANTSVSNNTTPQNPVDINTPDQNSSINNSPKINFINDCNTDFSCYESALEKCDANTTYVQENSISYPSNGTKYSFKIKYFINGFNKSNQCDVSLNLLNQHNSFLDSKRQEYLDQNYTPADVNSLEDLLNQGSDYLINKSGNCLLDASTYNSKTTSMDYLKSIMQNINNCSGDLFTNPTDPNKAPFYIYVK